MFAYYLWAMILGVENYTMSSKLFPGMPRNGTLGIRTGHVLGLVMRNELYATGCIDLFGVSSVVCIIHSGV